MINPQKWVTIPIFLSIMQHLTYAALSRGSQCFCSDVKAESVLLDYMESALCDKPCSGDPKYHCGGFEFMSLYRTSVPGGCGFSSPNFSWSLIFIWSLSTALLSIAPYANNYIKNLPLVSSAFKKFWSVDYFVDLRCSKVELKAKNSLPFIALASYPRSGNTWTRSLIEKGTGIPTGSVYWKGESKMQISKKGTLFEWMTSKHT